MVVAWLRRGANPFAQTPSRPARSRTSGRRLGLETLEDRIAPASRLFAVTAGGSTISELNPSSGAVVNYFPTPESAATTGAVGLAYDGRSLYFIRAGSGVLYELNPDTGAVLDSDSITVGSGYDGLAVVAGEVYIQDYATNRIYVFDPATDFVTRTLNPGVDLAGGIAGASSPGALFAPIQGGNLIAEIDPVTGSVTQTFQPGFPALYGAAFIDGEIYLGSASASTIYRYSRDGTFLGQLAIPAPVVALAGDDETVPVPSDHLVNGDFETGTLQGWKVFNAQTGSSVGFQTYSAANPQNSSLPAPPQGSYAVYDNHVNAGTYVLYQDVALNAAQYHTLSLQVAYENKAGGFITPDTLSVTAGQNQQFRIDVISPTGDLLSTAPADVYLELFRTETGDLQTRSPFTLSADLTPFAGQTVRLRIAVANNVSFLFVGIDDVRLVSDGEPPTGTVSGVKFHDLDGDGTRDAGEPGLGGWTIYADVNDNGSRDPAEPATVTAPDGSYTLTLTLGAHVIREEAQAGWVQTAPLGGGLFALRSQSNGIPMIYELDASGAVLNSFPVPAPVRYLGPQGLAQGAGSLFYVDGSQTQGGAMPHTMYELDPTTGAVRDSDVLPATADIAGLAYLGGLVYVQVYPTDEVLVFDPVTDTVVRRFTVLADLIGGMTGAADLNLLFGSNADGKIFAIDPVTGAIVRTLQTSAGALTGGLAYRNGELIAARYDQSTPGFRIDPQSGATLGTFTPGGTGLVLGLGGDGAVPGPHHVTVFADQALTGKDFGNQRDEGTVTGIKFHDLDGDGTRDADEPGLEGWTIYADLDDDGQFDPGEPSVVTAADGSYALVLPSGRYAIREVAQTDWWQTSPTTSTLYSVRGQNGGTPVISRHDATGAVVSSFSAPGTVQVIGPQGLAESGGRLFYVNGSGPAGGPSPHTLYELDPITGAVLDADPLPATLDIAGLAYLGGLVYVHVYPTDQVLVFDPDSDTVVRTFTAQADLIGGLTGAPDLGLLFGSNHLGQVFALDPLSGAVVRTLTPPVQQLTGGLAYYRGELIGASFSTQSPVYRINPLTGAVLGTITLGGVGFISGLGGDGPDLAHRFTLSAGQVVADRDFGNRPNSAPVAVNDAGAVGENGVLTVAAPGVLGNDSDPDSRDRRTITAINGNPFVSGSVVTLPSGARVTLRADGSYTYDPNGRFDSLRADQTATDGFTYTVTDSMGASSTATVVVTINGANDQPVAVAESFDTNEDTSLSGEVLANDSDPDLGDSRTVARVNGDTASVGQTITLASGARLKVEADGTFDYDPTGAFDHLGTGDSATDQFTYTIVDGAGAQSSATVTLVITGVNDAPVAVIDTNSTDEDTRLSSAAPGVLANDSDSDTDDTRTVVAVNGSTADVGVAILLASGATLTLAADGGYTYDPRGVFDYLREGESASETITYTIEDGEGATSSAVLTLTVQGRNDAPVAGDDAATTDEDSVLSVQVPGLLGNDVDADHDTTLFVLEIDAGNPVGQPILLPSGALLTVGATGSLVYDPNGRFEFLGAGETATETFTYLVTDGSGAEDRGTVTITITGVNDAPTAEEADFSTNEDTAVQGTLDASDAESDPLSFEVATGPAHGAVVLASDGTFTYTPAANYHGSDTFTYRVFDGLTYGALATVTLTVAPVNDAPGAVPASVTLSDAGEASIPLTGTDVETAVGDLVFTVTSLPGADAVLLRPDGTSVALGDTFQGPVTLTYRLRFAFGSVSDSFGYTVTDTGDPAGASNALTAGATVTVTGPANSTGVVRVGGTDGADDLVIVRSASGSSLEVRLNGQVIGTPVPLASITQVRAFTHGGADLLRLGGGLAIASAFDGGTGSDSFSLEGTAAADTFGIGSSAITFNGATVGLTGLETVTVLGGNGDDGFTVVTTGAVTATLSGGGGVDTLIGANGDTAWVVDAANGGTLGTSLRFDTLENLTGGTGRDTFAFTATGSVSGKVNGGAGRDLLDYGARSSAVTVDLRARTATSTGGVSLIEVVYGGSGNDRLTGSDLADLLFGGAGNDTLAGGLGNDVLVGGDGTDSITGGDGRDLLIGGLGGDTLQGGNGDDILIGARTVYDDPRLTANLDALEAIMLEWSRTDLAYNDRRNHLTGATSGGLNGAARLNGSTIFDDLTSDALTGNQNQDWFFAKSGSGSDNVKDKKSNETVTPL